MTPPGDRRAAALAREAGRLEGNRLWRVETPAGPAVQKYYVRKGGRLRDAWRGAMSRVLRGATATSPAARWRTEGELLAHWRAAGIDVPRDRTEEFPEVAGDCVRVLEWIEGPPLTELLASGRLDRAGRDAVLARAAAAWGRRHMLAVERSDPRLVQFHAGFQHLLVAADRVAAIDLEQGYLPGRAVFPLLAREAAACLRTLARCGDGRDLPADLAALVRGHPDRALLWAVAERALHPPGTLRRLARALDPRRRRKEDVLRLLRRVMAGA